MVPADPSLDGKRLPPATAALAATAGYGAGAACTAVLAIRRMRELLVPVPTETARQASETATDAVAETQLRSAPPRG